MAKLDHISFSAIQEYNTCPYHFKKTRLEGIKDFTGNVFTVFGTACHNVCEKLIYLEKKENDWEELFVDNFLYLLRRDLPEKEVEENKDFILQMCEEGQKIIPEFRQAILDYFGPYTIISVEEPLYEVIEGFDGTKFKGFVDICIRTADGIYHIIDLKTCSFGWLPEKRSDRITGYQLAYYKHFFSKKYNIDPKNIECHFVLLKRTAKKQIVEPFRITSGNIKINNAIGMLNKILKNIQVDNFRKDTRSCEDCGFKFTEHCKK